MCPRALKRELLVGRRLKRHPVKWRDPEPLDRLPVLRRLTTARATQNVVAMVPGRDRALAGREVVVIGAHFDHLGRSPSNALDQGDAVRNGADDNASGTAAVLELARLFAEKNRAWERDFLLDQAKSGAKDAREEVALLETYAATLERLPHSARRSLMARGDSRRRTSASGRRPACPT